MVRRERAKFEIVSEGECLDVLLQACDKLQRRTSVGSEHKPGETLRQCLQKSSPVRSGAILTKRSFRSRSFFFAGLMAAAWKPRGSEVSVDTKRCS